jgi:hypothetical protein
VLSTITKSVEIPRAFTLVNKYLMLRISINIELKETFANNCYTNAHILRNHIFFIRRQMLYFISLIYEYEETLLAINCAYFQLCSALQMPMV